MSYESRGAARPSVAPNPLVEPQRPGYCVRTLWPDDKGRAIEQWNAHVGWTPDREKAQTVARLTSGEVTTVPRHNGHCVEWSVVENHRPSDDEITHDV